MSTTDAERAWVTRWRAASAALAAQRLLELRSLTDQEALAATVALLDLAGDAWASPERDQTSGLVAQQALLHKAHIHS